MPPYTYHIQVEAKLTRQVEVESEESLSPTEINDLGIATFKREYGADYEGVEVIDYSCLPVFGD